MSTNDLFDYMKRATHQMQDEYMRIQKRAADDPGTAGDNGEENWAELFREWLPSNFHVVTKGRIMNTDGECSPQVDVLVLSPSYPEALLDRKEYLEGGVLAAFECKLTLKARDIRKAISNSARIRRLSRPIREGSPYKELHSRMRYGLLAHSHVWTSDNSAPIENIEGHIHAAEAEHTEHPKEVIDLICVSDKATWSTSKFICAGPYRLPRYEVRYGRNEEVWSAIQKAGGVIEANHICFAEEYQATEEKQELFTPIGCLLTNLLEMLAWERPSLRPLAEYFILSNLLGSGRGKGRRWTINVLSAELVKVLKQGGHLVAGQRWHEWDMVT